MSAHLVHTFGWSVAWSAVVVSSCLGGEDRPRAREAGIRIGILPTGSLNAITDVAGVRVGHTTLRSTMGQCTGVTAVLPHDGNLFAEKVPAAIVVGNGFGKLVGISQVNELGTIETPIMLTNTLATFQVADAVIRYTLRQPGNEQVRSVNPIVGETNDGYLNDIRTPGIQADDVFEAIRGARSGPVAEGAVGAGTGTIAFGFKGGIGTSSRQLPDSLGSYTIGVLVQSNFGGVLTVAGAAVGKELGRYYLKGDVEPRDRGDGSCMIVVATDAPVDHRQLTRLARRALLGLAATGSPMTHGSGDYVIAFSTARPVAIPRSRLVRSERLADNALSPLFQGVREATEEAIVNSLFQAETTTGFRGRTVEALPISRVLEIVNKAPVPAADQTSIDRN